MKPSFRWMIFRPNPRCFFSMKKTSKNTAKTGHNLSHWWVFYPIQSYETKQSPFFEPVQLPKTWMQMLAINIPNISLKWSIDVHFISPQRKKHMINMSKNFHTVGPLVIKDGAMENQPFSSMFFPISLAKFKLWPFEEDFPMTENDVRSC